MNDFQQLPSEENNPAKISNQELLNAIFVDDLKAGHTVWVSNFSEDPSCEQAKKHWKGHAWNGEVFPAAANNAFFGIAALKANSRGEVRRTKECMASVRCIMLDDIGTKAQRPPIDPSWLIETSPGNFQAGFIFEEPITDPRTVQRLCKALVADGKLTDAGGFSGVRYARLPVGCNTKVTVIASNDGQPFEHRLVEWRPDLRYHWRDWAVAMGLGSLQTAANDAEYGVFEDIGDENPVIEALKARGVVQESFG